MDKIKKDCFFCKPTNNPYIFHCNVEDELFRDISSEGCKSNCSYYCTYKEAIDIVKRIKFTSIGVL